jgi:hypothetical protein
MNACDVVVLPYKRVFTSGRALVASQQCWTRKVPCFLIPRWMGTWARFLREVVACPERLPGMGRYNLKRASGWNWDDIGRATVAAYKQCVAAEKKQLQPGSVCSRDPR